jgi:S-adenosylmethionine:tRNA ribosyltransferase-isomerase
MVEPIAGTPIAAAPGRARALLRPSARVRAGEELTLDSGHVLRVEDPPGGELRAISFEVSLAELVEGGLMPLPPYIERHGPDDRRALDRERYQTVYARDPGAIAAPTAGLHFTPELLARLEQQGVEIAALTLHVGAGTFLPVRTERLSEHPMHAERFEIAAETSARIAATRARGGRVIAVGTTTTRALEAAVDREGRVAVGAAETRLLIQPGHRFGVIDGLITNFHLPRSTLLALVAAFAGLERIRELYARAIEEGYRFYSYGDAMLLL